MTLTIPTAPISGQKTGTSGLRKKVAEIQKSPLYIENWIQSLMTALDSAQIGTTFILGGDGRYLNDTAAVAAISILAGNGVKRIIVGKDGLLSTPAVSHLIRSREAFGGIIMTASHNPAGPHGDWGIKFNCSNGEPAPEKITSRIYEETQKITCISKNENFPESFLRDASLGEHIFGDLIVEVVDPVDAYVELLRSIFDFEKISKFIASRSSAKIVFDAMHAITGIYAQKIISQILRVPETQLLLLNCVPSPDFNGGHPDPNLVYATDLVQATKTSETLLGAASDGDGDRNMIVGSDWFVTPSDSLAVIADYAAEAIPYFKNGLSGVARSMPTSRAVDVVCDAKSIPCFETPTGWKYFGNLMDAGKVDLCGEESFGTGANHIREKDGIWAVFAWLSILEFVNRRESTHLVTIRDINERHWDKYGRHVYCRCDYDEVAADGANKMMDHVRIQLDGLAGREFTSGWAVANASEYNYVDPVDKSEAKQQGLIVRFTNGSRLVFRLSGTGSAGATIRLYMEYYVRDWRGQEIVLEKSPLMAIALDLADIEKYTGRSHPSVVT
jgi:phosphoglucomutase